MQELQLYICICQSYTKNIIASIFFRTPCIQNEVLGYAQLPVILPTSRD